MPQNDLQRYEAALAAGDRAAARTLVERLLEAGVAPAEVLTDVIAAAQRTVGIRWQTGEWTVAEEHAATALSVSSVKVVMQYVRRTPVTRGRVLIACAEREWHALPGMIIECALRADGWELKSMALKIKFARPVGSRPTASPPPGPNSWPSM